MILFHSDYGRYPSAVIDYNTKNESFLRTAKILYQMGIKNWAFCLTVLDPDLIGVDPFDPNLSMELKGKIAVEGKRNPWYCIRELVRISEIGNPVSVPFRLNRANLFTIWSFLNHVDVLLIHIRQTGKSTSIDGLMAAILFVMGLNVRIHMVTKDMGLRQDNIERIKLMRDSLPPYFYMENPKDVNNKQEITNVALGNKYSTSVPQNSVAGATKIGRGMKAQIFLFDEAPYCTHIEETMPAALPAGTAARTQAKANNSFYGNIISTTAGMRDTVEGKYIYGIMDSGTPWTEAFYDSLDIDELHRRVKTSGKNTLSKRASAPLLVGIFSHRQLGYSDEWLEEAIANSRGNRDQIKRDFLNIWTCGQLQSPLSERDSEKVYRSEVDPLHVEFAEQGYMLRWYLRQDQISKYMAENKILLSIDTSDAIGNDNIGFAMTNVTTLENVMVAAINEANLAMFGYWLAKFLIKYTNVTLIIEMTSTARVIVDILLIELPLHNQDPFKRIYNSIVDRPEEYAEEYKEISRPMSYRYNDFYTKYRKYFGFKTTAESRRLLYGNILQLAISRSAHLVRDRILSKELRGLVVKNGRIDHTNSGHDDTCISWLLNHWFLNNTSNHLVYGIAPETVMSGIIEDASNAMSKTAIEQEKQKKLRDDIDQLVDRLGKVDNPTMVAKLEQRIKNLTGYLTDDIDGIYNMDSIRRKAKEERIKNKRKGKKVRI